MTLRISEYDEPLADVDLIDGKLKIKLIGKRHAWIKDAIEELRTQVTADGLITLTDEELFISLPNWMGWGQKAFRLPYGFLRVLGRVMPLGRGPARN